MILAICILVMKFYVLGLADMAHSGMFANGDSSSME